MSLPVLTKAVTPSKVSLMKIRKVNKGNIFLEKASQSMEIENYDCSVANTNAGPM